MKRRFKTDNLRSAALALLVALLLANVAAWPGSSANAAAAEDKAKDGDHRDARKAMRDGKYDEAARIYEALVAINADDVKARLGASFAYLKLMDYARCLGAASEVLKIQPSNARAHALAGVALLRSGYVGPASAELKLSATLDSRESLAYGGAAEVDYYEGRLNESRRKALVAVRLDPNEPDYVITYARASSRAEDFKEAADAYELFLEISPESDSERRDRIRGLIAFYRRLSGLRVHQLVGTEVSELPFYLGSDRRPYIRVKLNGRTAVFVIDTGSGFTVISQEAAKSFGVSEIAKGGKSQGVGGTGKFPIVYGLIRSLEIGSSTVRMVPCFIRTFHGDVGRPSEERADGFIGLSILSHFIAELDYNERMLRLDRRSESSLPPAGAGITVIPFRTTQNGLISIEAELDGKKTINAILDSGASSMVISTAAVERLKMDDQIIKGETRSVIGAAGVTPNVEMLFIRNCRVADLHQSNLNALILDLTALNETSGFEQSGILGGDFLRHFRLTIDFSRAQLAFQRPTTMPAKK